MRRTCSHGYEIDIKLRDLENGHLLLLALLILLLSTTSTSIRH
jgi:hypothetical protein